MGVDDWQTTTEDQLQQRDHLHRDIAILANTLRDNDQAVRIALEQ